MFIDDSLTREENRKRHRTRVGGSESRPELKRQSITILNTTSFYEAQIHGKILIPSVTTGFQTFLKKFHKGSP